MSYSGTGTTTHYEDGTKRGQIRNEYLRSQILDFSGCRVNKCTPSDIDGIMEFENKLFIALEVKHGNSEMHTGQRLMYERLSDNSKKPFYILQIRHFTDSTEAVDVGACQVSRYYYKGSWKIPENPILAGDAIRILCNQHGIKDNSTLSPLV